MQYTNNTYVYVKMQIIFENDWIKSTDILGMVAVFHYIKPGEK